MTVMTRIRQNMGIVVILVALSLVAFILTDFFTSFTRIFGGPPDVGEIAGETISYTEYTQRYNTRLDLARQQAQATGYTLTDNDQFFIMNDVWNNMVKEVVYEEEFDKTGVEVTGEELFDMFAGKNIAQEVRESFQAQFDQMGRPFNPDDMVRLLEQYTENPEARRSLKQFEEYLGKIRAEKKYKTMLKSGFIGSKMLANQRYVDQNRKVDLAFVGVNYSQISDSLVDVSDGDLRAYLNKNKGKYKQEDATVVNFVSFPVRPSAADSAKAKNSLSKLRKPFSEAKNDSTFTISKTRIPFTGEFVTIDQIAENARDSIVNGTNGQVYGPFQEGAFIKLYKLVDSKEGEVTYVKIDHILISPEGPTKEDTTKAREEAGRLRGQANTATFNDLAIEYSDDFLSKDKGGKLGWYGKGTYGEDFDKAVEKATVGSIIGPVKSARGFHVVRILDKTQKTFAVAQIEKEIFPGEETVRGVYREANKLLSQAQQSGDLNSVAETAGLIVRNSGPLSNDATFLPGATAPARQLILWAINEGAVGDFSQVYDIADQYIFAQVAEKRVAGVQTLEEVRPQIFREVANEKKAKMIKDKLGNTAGKDLNSIQQAYGQEAFVSNATDISFDSPSIPGIGNDPFIIGKALGMQTGEVSAPITGKNGVFIIQVTNIKEAPALDDSQLAQYRNSSVLSAQNRIETNLDKTLEGVYGVKDYRYKANF
jgi:peptidyl-prolyl cis-trans isomerase D